MYTSNPTKVPTDSPYEASFSDEDLRSEINEHREALGRTPIRKGTSRAALMRHVRLINARAPYGEDPWEK